MTTSRAESKNIIIYMDGGLASQMSAYSFGIYLKEKGYRPTFDLSWFDRYGRNRYLLKKVFGIEIEEATNLGRYKIYSSANILIKLARKSKLINLVIWMGLIPKIYYTVKPRYLGYRFSLDNIEEILDAEKDVYFWGYWAFFKYMGKNASMIRGIFRFPQIVDEINKGRLELIRAKNSISVHVRRGDYLKYPKVFNELTLDYYRRAFQIIKSRVDSPIYFIFSDDIKWCKEHFPQIGLSDKDAVYVSGNEDERSFIDMNLMKECKNNIIANSGFSNWAAFLNSNEGKIVIGPEKYYNKAWRLKYDTDLYQVPEENWVIIDN